MAGMLAGKAALVTGSTSGIGLAMIKALAGAGANVALHGLGDPSAIQKIQDELKDQHGIQTLYSGADLKQPKLIREMVKQVHDTFGRIDILVNNAGIQFVSPVQDFPEDKWDDIIAVCLNSAFHTTKAVIPHMLDQGWGRIINTGSMHALVASPFKSAYNAVPVVWCVTDGKSRQAPTSDEVDTSGRRHAVLLCTPAAICAAKHGIAGFTKTVALEMAQKNITCNAICPGYVLTDLVRNQLQDTARIRGMTVEQVVEKVLLADQPTKQFVKPEDLAGMVLHLCGPYSASITGACLSVDGGWTAR